MFLMDIFLPAGTFIDWRIASCFFCISRPLSVSFDPRMAPMLFMILYGIEESAPYSDFSFFSRKAGMILILHRNYVNWNQGKMTITLTMLEAMEIIRQHLINAHHVNTEAKLFQVYQDESGIGEAIGTFVIQAETQPKGA